VATKDSITMWSTLFAAGRWAVSFRLDASVCSVRQLNI
jgi:hypothetical protein